MDAASTPPADDRIEREIRIDAPIDVVWEVVTEPAHIEQWLADVVELDVAAGADGTFAFVDDQGGTSTFNVHVERLEPPHRFAFRWVHPDGERPGPGNAPLVEFTLVAENVECTRLTLVESGLRAVAWDAERKARYHRSHAHGWDRRVRRLRDYAARAVAR